MENTSFDRDLYLHRITKRKPSSQRQQELNFAALFRQAEIERGIYERNMQYHSQRYENGAGI